MRMLRVGTECSLGKEKKEKQNAGGEKAQDEQHAQREDRDQWAAREHTALYTGDTQTRL